jgi:hypothetical protein
VTEHAHVFGAVAAPSSADPVAEAAHAVLSASGSDRWLACPGSVHAEKMFSDEETDFALEGTVAHDILSLKLEKQFGLITAGDFMLRMQPLLKHRLYKLEMERFTDDCRDFCVELVNKARAEDPNAEIFIERRLDFSRWVPKGYGRGDFGVVTTGWAHFVDFKYGKGKPVSAIKNSQVRLYGGGTYSAYSWLFRLDKVFITIHQPRIGNVETEELTSDELLAWLEGEVRPKAAHAWKIHTGELRATDADYTPGKHCTFCKARGPCRKRAEWAQSEAASLPAPGVLTPAEIAALLPKVGAIASWASDVEAYALEQATSAGVKYPGFKLVEGRSNRTITNSMLAGEALRKAGYLDSVTHKEPELLGIGELERVVGGRKQFDKILGGIVKKPPGKPTLVYESDPRATWTPASSAASDFAQFIKPQGNKQ